MNRLERDYRDHLVIMESVGIIERFVFEPMRLRLGLNWKTNYTPDFGIVMAGTGLIEFHEVKGYWHEDARVKVKVAAATHPWFVFRAVQRRPAKQGGGWVWETFTPGIGLWGGEAGAGV